MHRNLGVIGSIVACSSLALLLACPRPATPTEEVALANDQGPPDDSTVAEVIKKCNSMDFDTAHPSAIQQLDANGQVMVQIFAAKKSSKTKLSQLGSKKGRIIAKVHNSGAVGWPGMALTGNGDACWYVWGSGQDEILKSRFVSLNGASPTDPATFEIDFHTDPHQYDEAKWYPTFVTKKAMGGSAALDRNTLFQLASFPRLQSGDTTGSGSTGWTTCLLSGCCRSRQ